MLRPLSDGAAWFCAIQYSPAPLPPAQSAAWQDDQFDAVCTL